MLLSWHNLAFFQGLMASMRAAIREGRLEAFRRRVHAAIDNPTDLSATYGTVRL